MKDMDDTFIADVGQKSAIYTSDIDDDVVDDKEDVSDAEQLFPDVKIDPPKKMPNTLKDDDFSFEKPKKQKKGNPFKTFLLMIICLGIGCFASYYYFEIYNSKDTEKKEVIKQDVKDNDVKESEIKPESVLVNKLIERYDDIDLYRSNIFVSLYSNKKTTIKDLDDKMVQRLAVKNINSFSFEASKLQDSLDELFGKDKFSAVKKNISFDNQCIEYEYDDGLYLLKQGTGCGGTFVYDFSRKIVKAVKSDKKLVINVAVAVHDGNKLYKGLEKDNNDNIKPIGEVVDISYSGFDMDKDYTKFNQYKYNFNYDEDIDNYYLESIELVEEK